MENLTTKITKGKNGYKAVTDYPMGQVAADGVNEAGERVLRLATMKEIWKSGVIIVSASVHTVCNRGGYASEIHAMGMGSDYGDFSRTVKRIACPRITEKHIRAEHEEALKQFPAILEAAKAFYAAKKAA